MRANMSTKQGHIKARVTEARESWIGRGDVAADDKVISSLYHCRFHIHCS
jgi:hypothetical protein